MLKHIYKTFLIAILSCSLMTLDISHQGLMFKAAQAETLKTDGVKDNNLMATLTMTAVGVLTQRLWKCKLTTDMMVAAAGGAAFVGGEILAYFKLKEVMKDLETEIKRDKDGKIEQKQIEALQKLRKSYEEAKKTAGTKKMLQQAAAVAFAAAAVLSYTQSSAQLAAETACQTGLTTCASACNAKGTALTASIYTAPMAPPFFAGAVSCMAAIPMELANDALAKVPGPPSAITAPKILTGDTTNTTKEAGATALCPLAAPGVAACNTKRALQIAQRGVCPIPPSAAFIPFLGAEKYAQFANYQSTHSTQTHLFEIISNFIIGKAHANLFSPMGIASSVAISYLLATSATLGATIDGFLFDPMNRAIVWGVLAGLTYAASSATDNVIAKIDANIAKIDAILNFMNTQPGGVATVNAPVVGAAVTPTKPGTQTFNGADGADDIDVSGLPGGKLPCFTGDGKDQCKSFEEQMTSDPGYKTMSPQSQSMMKSIAQTADGFNGKSRITRGTITEAGKLAGTSNAVRTALAKSKKDLTDKYAKMKKKIDIDGKERDFANSIEASMRAQLKKSNMSAAGMLGSMYGGSIPVGDEGATAVASTDESTRASDGKPMDAGVIDIGAASGLAGADLGGAAGEGDEASKASLMAIKGAGAKGTSIDDYDLKNDITKDKETSLFDLISNRYQKSGYPRLFKRVK